MSSPLFTPTRLGNLRLPNRVLMAPMTRNRAAANGDTTPMMETYYAQRAGAGLIITEMVHVMPTGIGYLNTPGLFSDEQVAGWRRITKAVHDRGGRIVVQLAHAGRISHPDLQPDGETPVAPSAVTPAGVTYTPSGPQPFITPRALEDGEIGTIVQAFAQAARRARAVGFDGIELHAANGYLLDQFLRDGTNRRTDAYGGDVDARARFLREVVEAVSAAWSPGVVGVRLSPHNPFNDMQDSDPAGTFVRVAELLRPYGLAYLHLIEGAKAEPRLLPAMRAAFGGSVILNEGFGKAEAEGVIARGEAEAISFGARFLANPDLPARFRLDAPLNEPRRDTFYGGGAEGYIDYPSLPTAA